ncbi:hypothetical protein [Kaarinaea lacus]
MILKRVVTILILLQLLSCASNDNTRGRIAELESVDVDIQEVNIEGGLDKAMQSYQKFLEQTPESELTPEAIRRLADLKVEKEYGIVTDGEIIDAEEDNKPVKPKTTVKPQPQSDPKDSAKPNGESAIAKVSESEKDFEKRATE